MTMATIHRALDGTYHPGPADPVPWVVRDARGFAVVGPACERCQACECVPCPCHGDPIHERGCVGLSLAYVRLDHWTALCEACAAEEGIIVVSCDCRSTPPGSPSAFAAEADG
jgi:hypothetical protein